MNGRPRKDFGRIRLLLRLGVLAALISFAGGCDWPMFRFGPAHTGSSPDTSIDKNAVASGSLALKWTGTLGDVLFSSPAVAGGVVYLGAQDGKLYAFDATGSAPSCSGSPATCSPLWTATTDGPVVSSPAVKNGVVYVGSCCLGAMPHKLYAFDAAGATNCSGSPRVCAPLWTAATGGDVPSSPTVSGGVVYIASDDGKLYTFDAAGSTNCSGSPKTCAPLWTASIFGNQNFTSPAVAGGVVYVTTANVYVTGEETSDLFAFDAAGATNCSGSPKTCAPLWSAHLAENFSVSSPAVAGGVVYVADGDNRLHDFDATDGTELWLAPLGTTMGAPFIASSPAVANGVIYVGSKDSKLYAFDASGTTNCSGTPKTCLPLWTGATGARIVSSPAVVNGVVYIGSFDHKLYAFDAAGAAPNCSASGTVCSPLWTATTGAEVISSPAVTNGKIYVASQDRKLYAFGL